MGRVMVSVFVCALHWPMTARFRNLGRRGTRPRPRCTGTRGWRANAVHGGNLVLQHELPQPWVHHDSGRPRDLRTAVAVVASLSGRHDGFTITFFFLIFCLQYKVCAGFRCRARRPGLDASTRPGKPLDALVPGCEASELDRGAAAMMMPHKSASASPGLREGLRGDEYLYDPPPSAHVVAKNASKVNPTMDDFPDEYVREHGVGLRVEQHGHGLM